MDPGALTVARAGVVHRIEPRAMQVLVALAESAGSTVLRDALMLRVWGHTHLTDEALTKLVSRLRRLFAEDPSVAIETVPRLGYRLHVQAPEAAAPAVAPSRRRWVPWASAAALVLAAAVALALVPRGDATMGGAAAAERVEPLTSMPGHEAEPALSPDGTRVAFSRRAAGSDRWDLFVASLRGDGLLQLTGAGSDDRRPAWSPDGLSIAYLAHGHAGCELRTISPLGGASRALGSCHTGDIESLAWFPDGGSLVLRAPEGRGLVRRFLDGGKVEALTVPPADALADDSPAVSPDGRTLAFVRWRSLEVADLYTLSLADGALRRLTADGLALRGLAWSADGREVVFSSNRAGGFSLWRVPASGGEPVRLAAGGYSATAPALSGDGRQLVYEQWTGRTNIYRIAVQAGEAEARPVTEAMRLDWNPQPSPDGRRVAFISDRTGSAELWVMDLAAAADAPAADPVRLTRFGGPYTSSPAWSPDGRWIVFDVPDADGSFDLWRVPSTGGQPQRISDDPAHDRFPYYSADGAWIYFSSQRSGEWQAWRMPADGGAAEPASPPGAYFSRLDSQGRLYFSRHDRAGLWRQEPGGALLLVPDLPPLDCTNWTLVEDVIWYVGRDHAGSPALMRYDIASGAPGPAVALDPLMYKSGLGVDGDGVVYFSRVMSSETDLLLLSLGAEAAGRGRR